MSQPQAAGPAREPLIDPIEVAASALAGVTVAALTSKLGVTGTLLGAGLASMVGTASASVYKAYLGEAVTSAQGRPLIRRLLAAFGWFAQRGPQGGPRDRRSILRAALLAAAAAFLLGVGAITALEYGAEKSLSCLLWAECPAGASETLPTVMGGGAVGGAVDNGPGNDSDGDGVPDSSDNCAHTPNQDQADEDFDGIGDLCEVAPTEDFDEDGASDVEDNCAHEHNPLQEDSDGDGLGDACDDGDGDGVFDAIDNCPDVWNSSQADLADDEEGDGFGDGTGDACDDSDGDGIFDDVDGTPLDPAYF
jgi:hypothetical protein